MRSLMMGLSAAVIAACAIGCGDGGGGGGGFEIAEGPLSGKFDGQDWKFASGWTDDFLSDEEDFFTTLHDVESEACGFGGGSERTILLDVPREPGEYDLGLQQNVTFAVNNENNVATTGRLVVEKVTDTEVDVGLYAVFGDDGNFEVSGHFTATICPPSP